MDWVADKQQNLFITLLESGKCKINVPKQSGSSENPLPGCKLPNSPCILTHSRAERGSKLSCAFHKGIHPIHEGSSLMRVCVLSRFSRVWLFVTLWAVARQAPLSKGFSKQEYWSRLPCPPPGDLPDPGMEPVSLTSTCISQQVLYTGTTWEALHPPDLT